ncbi:MAG: histidinol dehydrogenase [Thermovirga sp.]|nr:histidinol dehydrogenase [Thermovirga sp.]
MKSIKSRKIAAEANNLTVENRVKEILDAIRNVGKKALLKFIKELDGYGGPLKIEKEQMDKALEAISVELRRSIERAISNIRAFHKAQKTLLNKMALDTEKGITAGIRFTPVNSTGVYIPSGRYPLPSTVLMSVIPAQEAEVSRIVAISPARGKKGIHPSILAALKLVGVEEVYAMGGAHGVAALAYGVEGIEPVDFIAGPGNAYVTEAKKQLYGTIGIDGLAGPSEVLIIADNSADPSLVAADLLAQSEHDPMARSVLFSTDEALAKEVLEHIEFHLRAIDPSGTLRAFWEGNGEIYVGDIYEAIEFANQMAPEHLELAIADAENYLEKLNSFGAAFIGHNSAEAFGDYIAGTNHILPTAGTARWNGALWTGTFMRPQYFLSIDARGAASLAESGEILAQEEGLMAHKLSMQLRRKSND